MYFLAVPESPRSSWTIVSPVDALEGSGRKFYFGENSEMGNFDFILQLFLGDFFPKDLFAFFEQSFDTIFDLSKEGF